jgi:hypothetical protein
MTEDGEEQEGAGGPIDDLSSMSQDDLDALGRSLQDDLVRLRAARREVVGHSQLVAAERVRRRDRRLEESYARRRRQAVAAGDAVPEPPPTLMGVAAPTSASRRLAETDISVSRSPSPGRQEPRGDDAVEPAAVRGTGVSDHAIVRYMERALGIDMDRIRAQIMSPLVESAMQAGVTRVRTAEGVFVLRDGTVISFLPSESGRPRKVSRGRPAEAWSGRGIGTHEADD